MSSNKSKVLSGFVLAWLIFILATASLQAQKTVGESKNVFWSDFDETTLRQTVETAEDFPTKFRAVSLNVSGLQNLLEKAPLEKRAGGQQISRTILALPMPNGEFAKFRIEEAPIVQQGLLDRYPFLKTYRGQGVDDPAATVRFDLMPEGFHAIVLSAAGTVLIDPITEGDRNHYKSYYTRDVPASDESFSCGTKHGAAGETNFFSPRFAGSQSISSGATFRTYVIAIGTTAQFTQAHGGGTIEGGLAAVTTILNQTNAIYERDFSTRFILNANNDLLISTNSSGYPYSNNNLPRMLDENQTFLPSRIGAQNYDIGHVFGTGLSSLNNITIVGVAQLSVLCDTPKERGVSSTIAGFATFATDTFAHELGHQLGATHTFNNRSETESRATAFEPGFGFTIMGYGLFSSTRDVTRNYHIGSIEQIVGFLNSPNGSSCADITATNNSIPNVTAPGPFNIPKQTPFYLTAAATDADGGDSLTYDWQEYDLGPLPTGNPDSDADGMARPIFRSFLPTKNPTRYFPALRYILENANVPPTIVACADSPTLQCRTNETLPNITRTMNFQVVVRDNKSGGAALNSATSIVNVDGGSGPFVVTSPNTNISVKPLTPLAVSWEVANTDNAPVSAANVNIRLSIDGGNSFPAVLVNTPNDGAATVIVPNFVTPLARIMVEGDGNIFFDASNTNFTIGSCLTAPNNLVGWYRGENNADDSIGTNEGNLNGNGFTAGRVEQTFDITNIAGITAADNAAFNQQNFTIEAWTKLSSGAGNKFIAAKSGSDSSFGYEFGVSGGFLQFKLDGGANGANLLDDANVADGNFHHVAASYDGSTMRIYLDGSLAAQKTISETINYQNGSSFVIGSRENTNSMAIFQGAIDELSFYDRALSDSEIQTIFSANGIGKCDANDLKLSPLQSKISPTETVQYAASGGTPPYAYSFVTNNSGATINSATGLYTAGSTLGNDVIKVTAANDESAFSLVKVAASCVANQKTWDGEGASENWSEASNWSCDAVPTSGDTVIFNAASTKNATIDTNFTVGAIQINSGYTGTVSQGASNLLISPGGNGSGFSQSAGTFGGGGGTIDCDGAFNLSGGTFDGGSSTLLTQGAFTIASGATFNPGAGKVVFDGSGAIVDVDSAAVPNNVIFNDIQVNRIGFDVNIQGGDVLISTGTVELVRGGITSTNNALPATIEARGSVTIAPTFTDGTSNTNGILAITGVTTRTVTIPAGVKMPGITLNAANTLINTSGAGTIEFREKLRLQAGTIQQGDVNFNLGNLGYIQTGGTFTDGGGTMSLTENSSGFALSGGTFNGGSGTIDDDGLFNLSGGSFNAGSSTVKLSGNVAATSAATFNPGTGKFVFDGSCGSFTDIDSAAMPNTLGFNNVKIDCGGFTVNMPESDKFVVAGTLELTSGGFSTGTIEALGDVTMGSIFNAGVNYNLRFAGNTNQTFSNPNNTPFAGYPKVLTIDKGAGSTVTANGSFLLMPAQETNATLNITSGTLYLSNNSNLTTRALNIGTNGKLKNDSATTITLGGNLTNNGVVDLQGGAGCPEADSILIRSSDGNQRAWQGGGKYRLVDVDVQNMGGTGTKTVFSGTNSGGNNASWIFDPNCPTTLSITPSSVGVQTGQTQQFTAGGGFAPYAFSILTNISGGSINSTTGVYTAGTTAGVIDTVRVTDGFGNTADATVNTFGAANKLAFTVQPTNAFAGQAISPPIQVTVQDQFGNTVTNSSATISLNITGSPFGVAISGAVKTAVNGVATFDNLTVNRTGTYTLQANATGLTAAVSGLFNITAGAANKLAFITQPSDTTAGAAITPSVKVAVQDAFGNIVTTANNAITISIGSNPSGGTLSGTLTQNAVGGAATFNNLSIDNPGTGYTLTASSGSLTSATSAAFNILNPFVVTNTNDSGAGSLRQAIFNATNTAGAQTISFGISGTAPFTIAVNSNLPSVNNEIIDGTTQPGFAGSPIIELTKAAGSDASNGLVVSNGTVVKGLVINRFNSFGMFVTGSGTVIQGNFIGTNIAGNAALGNRGGLYVSGSNHLIGGSTAAERNIISGNNFHAIDINSLDGSSSIIKGNYIGTNAAGSSGLPNSHDGIQQGVGNGLLVIGGTTASEENLIAFNGGDGISIGNSRVTVKRNSIHTNAGLGIDIGRNRVTMNDSGDADTRGSATSGVTTLQNFPVINSTTSFNGNTAINGSLNSTPSQTFTLDFYSNATCDASGFGEGETYLGSTQISTDGSGFVGFTANLPVTVANGRIITATTTDANGNTSEFSQCSRPVAPAVFSISGRITDNGNNPISGVSINLQGTTLSLLTDSNGFYNFNNVPRGSSFTLVPSKAGYTFTPAGLTFNNVSANLTNQNFVGTRHPKISGKIMSSSGGGNFALPGVTVTLSGAATAATTTDNNGNYVFNNLTTGNYTVTPSKMNFEFVPTFASRNLSGSDQVANFTAQSLVPLTGRITSGNLKVMNADGSALLNLFPTGNASTGYSSGFDSSSSPDGSGLVYVREGDDDPYDGKFHYRIFRANFDGTNENRTGVPGDPEDSFYDPTWSSDGIFYVWQEYPSRISLMPVGYTVSTLFSDFGPKHPSASPDGTKIAFSLRPQGNNALSQIYTINKDKTNLTQLTFAGNNGGPKWSSGDKIAFVRQVDNDSHYRLYTMNPNGTNQIEIPAAQDASGFAWSPDGAKLFFTNGSYNVINADGSNLRTYGSSADFHATSWSQTFSPPTPSGSNVTTVAGAVSVNFNNVATAGSTTVVPIPPNSAGTLPSGFTIGNQAYEITTTASVTPTITVCFNVPATTAPTQTAFNRLSVMHNENGNLVDRTTSRNFSTRTICAQTTSLSPFALAEQIDANLPRISGLILDAGGNPMSGVSVNLSGTETQFAQTDSDGIFNFVNLTMNGNYNVSPKQTGYLFTEYNQDFVNLTNEQTVVFTGTAAAFQISGRIADGNGAGVNNVTVQLGGASQSTAQTGASGNYTFTNLPADGFYTITPSNSVSSFTPASAAVDSLTSNAVGIDFQTFAPTAASVSIGGRVTTATGGGIIDVRLTLTDSSGQVRTVTTTASGDYRFDDVQAGETYILSAMGKHYTFSQPVQVLNINEETTEVNFIANIEKRRIIF